ncbi:DgyrCDS12043 [Dimorphilus gyrociliatus]|uniref:DgyrCDS12043 n=1 Tax=Dimorphilus gyrociliatus TaxID=2664684 RepID=A0A7I8W6C4_9ANNE|nr:DgyrCDS12043 [Dimorphilus gyrociliatus]
MPKKSAKTKRAHSTKSGKKSGKKSAKKRAAPKSAPAKLPSAEMNEHALTQIYYCAHNAVDALEYRGFAWPEAPKKGKKKKKK